GLPGSLRATVLLCLLALGCRHVEGDAVDAKTLARIIEFFNNNYKKVEKGDVRQFAVAINVPKEQCLKDFVPNNDNFLTKEVATNVKNKIYDRKIALYEGSELIAAGTLERKKYNRHSESILMNPAESSPMAKLLNNRKEGCVVFYTYNSPCIDTCINITSKYNILEMLKTWSKRTELKAFVYRNIWKFDKDKNLSDKFKVINDYVLLYRCVSAQECYKCYPQGKINQHCVTNN
ncbi:hypothetical protein NFI96_034473, partial [Prochilodus magdalenae]